MNHSLRHLSRRAIISMVVMLVFLLALVPALTVVIKNAHAASAHPATITFRGRTYAMMQSGMQPPTDAQCRAQTGSPCYSPQEMHRAYGLTSVLNAGYTGAGQTIVLIDSYGSPTVLSDLKTFDAGYGLPDPPSFKVLAPLGTIKFDPNNSDMVGWAVESTLDVEWAHAMAPGANIVLMTSPVSETQGVQGMPEFLFLEQYDLQHKIGKIVSQSWGTTENTLFTSGGRQVLNNFNAFYQKAAGAGMTIFASSGDGGVANPNVNGKIYPFPTVGFPASSPYVTAVGGTSLTATTTGQYQSEAAWGGSGGGVSQYFKEPAYQDGLHVQHILKGYRGLPDIAANADPATPVLIYLSFLGASNAGYYTIGGTSEASPLWSGIIADGNQWAGRPLGFINPALYLLGNGSDGSRAYHDITVGNNSADNIPGYFAKSGWDLVTGWGSPQAGTLLQELIEITGGIPS